MFQAFKRPLLSSSILPRSRGPAALIKQQIMAASSTWTGEGTQKDFMHKDECITVNDEDEILGHCSKHACHRFEENQPNGILHRAFRCEEHSMSIIVTMQQACAMPTNLPVWTTRTSFFLDLARYRNTVLYPCSVFLFDGEGRLLLQQRAAGKVSYLMPNQSHRPSHAPNKHPFSSLAR